jgi:hypothetical protein
MCAVSDVFIKCEGYNSVHLGGLEKGLCFAFQRGMFGRSSFTRGDCCKITNNYIPNKMKTVAKYHSKAFCGQYSKDGNYFLSACQGEWSHFVEQSYSVTSSGLSNAALCSIVLSQTFTFIVLCEQFWENYFCQSYYILYLLRLC